MAAKIRIFSVTANFICHDFSKAGRQAIVWQVHLCVQAHVGGSEFVSDPDAEGCAFEIFRSAYGVAGVVVFFRDADANQCCLPVDGLDAHSQHGSGAKSSDSAYRASDSEVGIWCQFAVVEEIHAKIGENRHGGGVCGCVSLHPDAGSQIEEIIELVAVDGREIEVAVVDRNFVVECVERLHFRVVNVEFVGGFHCPSVALKRVARLPFLVVF